MSDFISKIGHLDPRFYSLIYCDTGGPDVGVQMSDSQEACGGSTEVDRKGNPVAYRSICQDLFKPLQESIWFQAREVHCYCSVQTSRGND